MYTPPHPHFATTYLSSPQVFIYYTQKFQPFQPGIQDIKILFGNFLYNSN